ncbi:MAG: glycosyltransferase family 4 protein [Acidimicrobiia bacterium]|nr:glycosyltransferase family 4 protein [Acidimicrobiia bacterium]
MKFALDATYSVGDHLSGVGVYSREILYGLAAMPEARDARWLWCYRPHRFLRSVRESLPRGCSRRLLRNHSPRAALFHGLNQRLPGGRLPRAVATFHDLFVLTGDYSSPDFRRRFAAQAREAASRADLVIAVSEFTASQVEGLLHVPRSRIRVVAHGVRTLRNAPDKAPERVVLSVGALQKRKNTARLVEAFEGLPGGWKLVLAGSSGYGAEEALRRVEQSPRRADIEVTGYVDDQELARQYARASLFAFPSLDEGFGMPVLDAMARGVPVVASNRSALREVCGDAALLVNPEEVDEIRQSMKRLMEEEPLREELIAKGKQRAAQFRWEEAVRKTWQVYQELTGA